MPRDEVMPNARVSAAEFSERLIDLLSDVELTDGEPWHSATKTNAIIAAFQAEREHSEKVAEYARHHDDCAIELYVFEGIEEPPPCDCGLHDLLKGSEMKVLIEVEERTYYSREVEITAKEYAELQCDIERCNATPSMYGHGDFYCERDNVTDWTIEDVTAKKISKKGKAK